VPVEGTRAGDHGRLVTTGGDAGAEAIELVDHDEAVLENVLVTMDVPSASESITITWPEDRSGSPGVAASEMSYGPRGRCETRRHAVVALLDLDAHQLNLSGRVPGAGARRPWTVTSPAPTAPAMRWCRFDAVGDHLVAAYHAEVGPPCHVHRAGAGAPRCRRHRAQVLGQVDDLGLRDSLLDDRLALRSGGRHEAGFLRHRRFWVVERGTTAPTPRRVAKRQR